jgi:hypothetical protein
MTCFFAQDLRQKNFIPRLRKMKLFKESKNKLFRPPNSVKVNGSANEEEEFKFFEYAV